MRQTAILTAIGSSLCIFAGGPGFGTAATGGMTGGAAIAGAVAAGGIIGAGMAITGGAVGVGTAAAAAGVLGN